MVEGVAIWTHNDEVLPLVMASIPVDVVDDKDAWLSIITTSLAGLNRVSQVQPPPRDRTPTKLLPKSVIVRIARATIKRVTVRVRHKFGDRRRRVSLSPERVCVTAFLIARHLAETNRNAASFCLTYPRRVAVEDTSTGLALHPPTGSSSLLWSKFRLLPFSGSLVAW
jgi:hypothetical protein